MYEYRVQTKHNTERSRNFKNSTFAQFLKTFKEIDFKAVHFVIRGNESLTQGKQLLELIKGEGYNAIIVLLADGVELKSLNQSIKHRWSRKEFEEFVETAKALELEVIPEVKLLTHQEKFFTDQYPELMFNSTTYDTTNEQVYKVVFSVIDEIIQITGAKKIHIGHDELLGYNPDSKLQMKEKGEPILSPDMYLMDLKRINTYFRDKGLQTMVWGDMFLAESDFPNMFRKNLNGNEVFANMIAEIPKDIIICDWQYFGNNVSFPTYDLFISHKLQTYGAVWHNTNTSYNLITYISNKTEDSGIIVTTWYNWDTDTRFNRIAKIIKDSSQILKNVK